MKRIIGCTLLAVTGFPAFAFAADAGSSGPGLLLMAFLAFCAAIILAQLIPALLLLTGMIQSLFSGSREKVNRGQIR